MAYRVGKFDRVGCFTWLCCLVLVSGLLRVRSASSQTVTIDGGDAEVWLSTKTVAGTVSEAPRGTLYVGDEEYTFSVEDNVFEVTVQLRGGTNALVACAGGTCSDTVRWTLGYFPRPEVYAFAEVTGRQVDLHAEVLEGTATSYAWSADASNPAGLTIEDAWDSTATARIPDELPEGEYYFDLLVSDANGGEGHARTFVTVVDGAITAFDIWSDHAAWVDRAIVYEVTPYIFEGNGKWRDVTARLGEVADLGVNTLWIQPTFKTHGRGQGYDITDYFELRPDLGTESDLRALVRTAKDDFGMRVLFDFVPNHTSIQHPYARDVAERGKASPYYDFYLTGRDDAAYSQHYSTDKEPFIYYFWEDLVIVDWDNPEVYRWMMEAGRKWIEEFDIDGYRIDAVWGVNARTPDAMQKWRFDLKRIKPEIFLLGEDKATWPSSFEKRFDAAYDWYPEEDWVSHWTWQVSYSATQNHTLFNTDPVAARSERIRDALTNRGDGWHSDAKVFRFLQNNDTFPFIASHGIERTKMAGTLLFALPGIPMLYNGQEIGHDRHPYATWQIFGPSSTIREQDEYGLYDHYRHLTALRATFPVLSSDTFAEVAVTPDAISGSTFAFRRWQGGRHVLAVVNMDEQDVRARLALPLTDMDLDENRTYYLTDLLTGESRTLSGESLRSPVETVSRYSTRLFILDDEVAEIPTTVEPERAEVPGRVVLHPNFPNPFNPSTTVSFELPHTSWATLKIFDVLGREVVVLVDEVLSAGRHTVHFDADGLASGLYVYQLEGDGHRQSRRMILTK